MESEFLMRSRVDTSALVEDAEYVEKVLDAELVSLFFLVCVHR